MYRWVLTCRVEQDTTFPGARVSSVLLVHRQADHKAGAAVVVERAFYSNAALMLFNNTVHKRQPKACPAPRWLAGDEGFECRRSSLPVEATGIDHDGGA